MTGHGIARMEHVREFEHVAHCECGHESHAPNPGTAEARHLIHVHIENARAALKGGNGGA